MPATVILGCGIQGLSAAYALAKVQGDGSSITLVDIAEGACEAASGRPTAFLSDAHAHNADLQKLVQYSLAIHAQFAEDHKGAAKWQYQMVQNYEAVPAEDSTEDAAHRQKPEGFEWLAHTPWPETEWSELTEYYSM